ncbi:MAG: hypothetical protein Q9192_005709 [Flavoplaca navasiana]
MPSTKCGHYSRAENVYIADGVNGQKLKCNVDQFGCHRCQSKLPTSTHPSSSGSADTSNSKRRQPASKSMSSSNSPPKLAKRQQTRRSSDAGPAGGDVPDIQVDLSQPLSSMDLKDGFWTSGLVFNELLHDPKDAHSNEPQGLEGNLGEKNDAFPSLSPIPETQGTPPYSMPTGISIMNDDNLNNFFLTPPSTANPTGTPTESPEFSNQGCGCIRSLANILQRIGGDGNSDSDEADRFDILLLHLRDGIETCKHVLPCKQCSLHTTNSMFIVTIVQQLATISQDLCLQLLTYQQQQNKNPTTSSVSPTSSTLNMPLPPPPPPLFLHNADISVGRYQLRPAALRLGFLFPILRVYLDDLKLLLQHLRNRIRKGTKACKLLGAAAEVVQTARGDWQTALNGLRIDDKRR